MPTPTKLAVHSPHLPVSACSFLYISFRSLTAGTATSPPLLSPPPLPSTAAAPPPPACCCVCIVPSEPRTSTRGTARPAWVRAPGVVSGWEASACTTAAMAASSSARALSAAVRRCSTCGSMDWGGRGMKTVCRQSAVRPIHSSIISASRHEHKSMSRLQRQPRRCHKRQDCDTALKGCMYKGWCWH